MTLLHLTAHTIHSLVSSGRITAKDGALLLELKREIDYARKPRWERALRFVARMVLG